MRTVGINVYKFDELEKDIQEKLIEVQEQDDYQFYLDYELDCDMNDIAQHLLEESFKGAEYKRVYYDLSFSQGSGAMIEFDIDLKDINSKYKMLSKKEITRLENIRFNTEVRVYHNDNLYYHENTFDVDYEDCTFYNDNMEDIGRTIDEMIKRFGEDIYSMNRELTKKGYALFDAFPNRDMAIFNLRENEYFKDGTIYNCGFAEVQDGRTVMNEEEIKDLIYKVEQETENELDEDYESDYKEDLTEQDFNMLSEFLKRFIHKLNLTINDEMRLKREVD